MYPPWVVIRAAHLKFSKDKFCVILGEEKQVLSASSSLCGRALYHRAHNYASRQTAGSEQSVQTLVYKFPPLPGFLVAYWPIPNRDLGLTGRVIFLTVVSSLLPTARLYESSRHLEYYLWYTLANSPIGFCNRLKGHVNPKNVHFLFT